MNWCVFSIIAEHIKTTALIIHKFSQNPNIDKTMCFPAEKLLLNLPKLIRIFAYDCFGNIIASAAGWAHLIQRQSWLETPKQPILGFLSLPVFHLSCLVSEIPFVVPENIWAHCTKSHLCEEARRARRLGRIVHQQLKCLARPFKEVPELLWWSWSPAGSSAEREA